MFVGVTQDRMMKRGRGICAITTHPTPQQHAHTHREEGKRESQPYYYYCSTGHQLTATSRFQSGQPPPHSPPLDASRSSPSPCLVRRSPPVSLAKKNWAAARKERGAAAGCATLSHTTEVKITGRKKAPLRARAAEQCSAPLQTAIVLGQHCGRHLLPIPTFAQQLCEPALGR